MPKALARFTIEPTDAGYALHIEDEDGETLEFSATPEQLDLIGEAIDEHLADGDDLTALALPHRRASLPRERLRAVRASRMSETGAHCRR